MTSCFLFWHNDELSLISFCMLKVMTTLCFWLQENNCLFYGVIIHALHKQHTQASRFTVLKLICNVILKQVLQYNTEIWHYCSDIQLERFAVSQKVNYISCNLPYM